jgi:hypothetical protein
MILRRLAQNLREQNWTAISIEFVLLVLGVFLGIQVANWNADRLERIIERETLIRLHADIEESIAGQDRDLRFLEQQLADQKVVVAALDACAVAPEDEAAFQRGIATLGYINPPRLFRRTIDEIAASGRTELIRNAAIAEELARILALVEWRAAAHSAIVSGIEPYRERLELRVRYTLDQTFEDRFVPNHKGGIAYDIAALCADPRIANGVAAVSYQTLERLEAYRPIVERYRAFLPLIEAELRDRWGRDLAKDLTR